MGIFCFTLPIGWDELGVIATVAAVAVALRANAKATKQLKSALAMQEQSKNVELMDKRIAVAEDIQHGKKISELTLKVLFDNEIFEQYQKWIAAINEEYEAQRNLDNYLVLNQRGISEIGAKESAKRAEQKKADEESRLLELIESYISKSIQPLSSKTQ